MARSLEKMPRTRLSAFSMACSPRRSSALQRAGRAVSGGHKCLRNRGFRVLLAPRGDSTRQAFAVQDGACRRRPKKGSLPPSNGRSPMGQVWIWIRNAMLLAVLAAFAFFFGQPSGGNGSGGGRNVVANVNGEEIPRDVFEFFREQNEEMFKQYQQQGADSEQLRKLIDEQTRASLLRRYL